MTDRRKDDSSGSTLRKLAMEACRIHEDCNAADKEAEDRGEGKPEHYALPSLQAKKFFTLFEAAQHAMQTGVAIAEQQGGKETTPKHLRVGVNTMLCNHAALVHILIKKGLFTEEEYAKATSEVMKEEQHRYEKLLGVKLA